MKGNEELLASSKIYQKVKEEPEENFKTRSVEKSYQYVY